MSYQERDVRPLFRSMQEHYFAERAGVDFSTYSLEDLEKLWREALENGIHGLCFSPYEAGQHAGDYVTEQQIRRRMCIIKPYIKWMRSFSCLKGNEYIPQIAREYGIKTLVGAWLSRDVAMNEKEIRGLISLARQGYVDVAAVGNEVMYRSELSEEQLLEYIYSVKKALPEIPVGYVDAYYEFSERPKIVEACDVVLSNCYPYWEGTGIEHAFSHMQQMFGYATHIAQGKKVIIAETGWPSQGDSFYNAFPSRENAMRYFINSQVWSAQEGIEMFYFSSFDELWKVGAEGSAGAYWGLWDKDENIKF